MGRNTVWRDLECPRNTVAAVRKGHPWVYREAGVRRIPAGEPVRLVGPTGKPVGFGLADDGTIAVRVLGLGEPPKDFPGWIRGAISRADRFRTRLMPPQTDGYRVVSAAGDALPGLIVDRYADVAVVRLYAKAWERWLDAIVIGVRELGWASSILRRFGVERVDGKKGTEDLWGPRAPDVVVFEEHGMRLISRPHVGQKTGMFLDQREHRHLIAGWSGGRTVVNLFAYNGGFSVAAALGGAARVTTVDIAPDAIEDAKENFRLNGISPDQHAFEVADVFSWRPKGYVDLLILDPPSLARGKDARKAARRAYVRLHRDLVGPLSKDGLLASASCTSWLDKTAWQEAVEEGLRSHGLWSWRWISGEPTDHPVAAAHREAHYLKFGLLTRRGVS